MEQYSSFQFEDFAVDLTQRTIELTYALDHTLQFRETLTLPEALPLHESPALFRALRALHLCGGISYYKTCLPKTIDISGNALTPAQAHFWNEVYENGLGEFFFRNNLDPRGLIHFPSDPSTPFPSLAETRERSRKPRVLVPVGGGKDSVVSIELLRDAGFDCTLLRIGEHPLIDRLAREAKLPLLTVKRALSPALFRLNEEEALNGHVPITAYLSFLAIVVALLGEFDAVAMSNERSASYGNIEYFGKEINHQWSKGIAFERLIQDYIRTNVTTDVAYFSLLRPFSELQIAQLFTQHSRYLPLTTSCNTNWRIVKEKPQSLWCGVCPKCAFVFALFAACLHRADITKIFGKDLFADEALLSLYRALLGLEGTKPFECVGTPEETQAAFLLAHERGEWDGTPVMRLFLSEVLPNIRDPKKLTANVLTPSVEHCIPHTFLPAINVRP